LLGTPIAAFLDEHQEEIVLRMEQTQLMIADAVKESKSEHKTLQEKFSSLRTKFHAKRPSAEVVEKEIEDLREAVGPKIQSKDIPKPNLPVYELHVNEAQVYIQSLVEYVQKTVLNVNRTSFRKWPIGNPDGTVTPATEFDLWCPEVESVLPRLGVGYLVLFAVTRYFHYSDILNL
jgi:hypothetical protein